jgi:thioredoxin 1
VAKILDVTDDTFEADVLKSETPVLIDFWAEWCAPCRRLSPKIKELAEEYGAKLRVVKIDVDANPKISARLQVRAMPTLLMIKGGAVVGQLVGDQPKDKIKGIIDPALVA